jgi:hypothetical protein
VHEFVTRTTIKATAERVWRILTDPAGYAEWNPEIVGLAGTMAAGGRIEARVKVGGGAIRTVPMRVTAFEGPLRMEWTGGLPLGLFTGRRIFTLTPAADAVEFRMLVQMIGPLASLMVRAVGDRQTEIDGFSAGLKARAERAGRVDDNAGVEIHDSTLERIESQGSDLVATMDAYVHRSEGEVGVDRGTGWSQSVEFRFRRGRVVTSHATTPLGLRDGRGSREPTRSTYAASRVSPSRAASARSA